jgi:hypothetical protein
MKTLIGIVSIIVLAASPAGAQNPNLGTSGAQFLEIPAGARPSAIGGAVVASARDASALFWNPAGIVNVASADLHLSHTSWWASMSVTHAAVVLTDQSFGSFGLSVALLSVDKMEVTTELEPEGTGQFFDARDLMIGATYARRLTEDFSVGVTAKYVNQRIWSQTASGMAFDVGTQYHIDFRDLTIAMSMTNFGGDMRYDGQELSVKYDADPSMSYNRLTPARLAGEDYALPLRFQVGVSIMPVKLEDMSLLLEVDAVHPNDNDERLNVGGELNILQYFNLRGGYRFGYDTERATFGAGVDMPLGDLRVVIDYAYATYDLLPSINRFSLGIRF